MNTGIRKGSVSVETGARPKLLCSPVDTTLQFSAKTQSQLGSGSHKNPPFPDATFRVSQNTRRGQPRKNPQRMKKYLIGVLYYGPKDDEHDACMKALEKHPRILNLAEIKGCPYIDIGRGTLAEYALNMPECEGILFVDHDILFTAESVDQILESCDASRGVVGAAYSMRSPGSKMIGAIDVAACGERPIVFFQGGGVYPALYLGMGFTAIHKDAFKTIADRAEARHQRRQALVSQLRELLPHGPDHVRHLFDELIPELKDHELPYLSSGVTQIKLRPFFSLLQREGAYYGEDVSFCLRAKDAGVPVDMDTRVRVAHKGAYAFEIEDCSFVVPILHRLEGVMTGAPAPVATPASPHAEVRAAVESSSGKSTEELLGARKAPPETLDIDTLVPA